MQILKPRIKKNTIDFEINSRICPLECALNACYIFLDRFFVFMDGDPKSKIKVTLKSKEEASPKQLARFMGEFNNELLSQSVRLRLVKETKNIQEQIISRALAGALPKENLNKPPQLNEEEIDKIIERELKALEKQEKTLKPAGSKDAPCA